MTHEALHSLHRLRIDEVSLVDDPCNDGARVVIVKNRRGRAPSQETPMDLATLTAALADAEERISTLEKARSDDAEELTLAKGRVTELEGELEAARVEITKAKPGLSAEEQEAELLKGLPESLRTKIEADRVALAKAREREETEEGIAKARAVGATETQAATLGPILTRIRKGRSTEKDADEIEALLKGANAQARAAGIFGRLGSAQGGEGGVGAAAQIDGKVAELRKAKPTLSAAEAEEQVLSDNPELYTAYLAERRAG